MKTRFFDEGVCGIPQFAIVGVLNAENTKEKGGQPIQLDVPIPEGFRVLRGYTVTSADLAGPTKVSCGIPDDDDFYYKDAPVTAGKGIGGNWALTEPPSRYFTATVDNAITAGKIEFIISVVRLEV